MGLFSSSTKLLDTRTNEAKSADQFLNSLLNQGTPQVPTEKIAGMSPLEQQAQALAQSYGSNEAEGLGALREAANASTDVTQDPSIQALMKVLDERGSRESNRLNRSLMTRGVTGGSARDELGRNLTEVNNNILATLTPYVEAAKNRKLSAAQLLNQLGESSTLSRLNALSTTGSLPRTLEQLSNTAEYQQLMQQLLFPYQTQANVASAIKSGPGQTIVQSPSLFQQASQAVNAFAKG